MFENYRQMLTFPYILAILDLVCGALFPEQESFLVNF